MSPNIDPDRAVERTDAALDTAGTIREDIPLDKRLAPGFLLLNDVA
jgi:hypothetical protein